MIGQKIFFNHNMKKNIIIFIVVAVVVGFGTYAWRNQPEEESGLANPAAVYCEEQGGILVNRMFSAGVSGYCLFDDGSECNQWEFYRGECQKGNLKVEVLKEGVGEPIEEGRTAVVHYTGSLVDGTKFDSSIERGEPFSFLLGAGQVITGWEKGVLGMKTGEKRILTIAPNWAYEEKGIEGVVPGNATLVFTVELLEIR